MKFKTSSVRILAMTALVVLSGLAGSSCATADSVVFQVGSQGPPPPREDRQWQRPYRTAVWIPGHYEWSRNQYVWIGGYYGYPPHGKSQWVSPRYQHHKTGYTYRPGYWSN